MVRKIIMGKKNKRGRFWILLVGIPLIIGLLVIGLAFRFWPMLRQPNPAAFAAKVERDVVFGQAGEVVLKLDIFSPTNAGRAFPVVMYVHGGGWKMGSKSMLSIIQGPAELLRRGFAVVAINYRLAPDYKFPAMLEDAKCAVRFLRSHAKNFNLDPDHIGAMGDSAGGHLSALLGLTDSSAGFEGSGGWSNVSSRVQAVVVLYGPTDFSAHTKPAGKFELSLLRDGFGATGPDDPILQRASPVTYVSTNAPPFLILHGDHDSLVSIQQSQELHAKLQAAGTSSTFVVITNFSHGFTPLGLKASPTSEELAKLVADFFDQNLR